MEEVFYVSYPQSEDGWRQDKSVVILSNTLWLHDVQILRLMKGYDEFNTILLPPRLPGEKLPPELLEYYEGVFHIQHTHIPA